MTRVSGDRIRPPSTPAGRTESRPFRSTFPSDASILRTDLGTERDAITGFRTRSWGPGDPLGEFAPIHPTIVHAAAVAAKQEATRGITLLPEDWDGSRPGEPRSFRAIYHGAMRAAVGLLAQGVAAGDRVLLVLPTSFGFVEAFLGAMLVGAVPVPAYPPAVVERARTAIDRLLHVARASGARVVVTDRALRSYLGELAGSASIVTVDDFEGLDGRKVPKVTPSSGDAAMIQYTSGSTGNPRGVLLSHANLVANAHALGQAIRINRKDGLVSWLPLYHDMGLIGTLLFAFYWRLPLTLMSPVAFLARPSRWLWAIHHSRATLSPAPNFAFALAVKRVTDAERKGLDLSSWRRAFDAAEPVNVRTLVDFERVYAPHGFDPKAFLPGYGLAEGTLAATVHRPGERYVHEQVDRATLAQGKAVTSTGKDATTVVSVGHPMPGHQVTVVDEHGRELPPREVGHIVVRGPSVMQGYYGDAEATRKVLRDGALWTGDLGYTRDGLLFVVGRVKDLIIVAGKNYYAEDLERVAARVEGVRAGGVAAFAVYDEEKARDLVVVVCETRLEGPERAALAAVVAESVTTACGVRVDEVVLAPKGTIPKTPSGKIQRGLCRERYLADGLSPRTTGKLDLAALFVRSRAGFLAAGARKIWGRQRDPEARPDPPSRPRSSQDRR